MIFNEHFETMPQEEIQKLQLDRLKQTLSLIKNSNSSLKSKYDSIEPYDIKSLDDLKKLPFTTKEELREAYPLNHITYTDKIVRIHTSSGTTGTPVINAMSQTDVENWAEIVARCFYAAGVDKKDRIQIMPSFGLFNGGFGFHFGAQKIGAFIIPMGAGRTLLQLKFIKDFQTTAICSIASYPQRLIEVANQNNFDFSKTNLRVAILGAETWSDELRARIESQMRVKTFDIIGMTETGGVGMGIDCEAKSGIHIWEDHYIAEIVDPNTLNPLDDGKEGELVITTLTREGLPLIRYRTKDITKIVSRDKCDCGRTHLRVSRLKGRTDDMLKVKGVNFYPSQIEQILLQYETIGPYYQIVLENTKGKDEITIILEKTNGFSSEARNRLENALYDLLGFHCILQIVPENTIQRMPGKMVRVIDKRQK
ncbi:phenylacetate--CoA ligase family protein [Desulfurella sp.]|uniref:phenylacetate--CoA ligase family protein n=1 Tax=Desulfurella sp. TaxID=1962857 RepID=UPI0025B84F78|nr:phenylacetate--CoA ligase [Desulfurella sp.]